MLDGHREAERRTLTIDDCHVILARLGGDGEVEVSKVIVARLGDRLHEVAPLVHSDDRDARQRVAPAVQNLTHDVVAGTTVVLAYTHQSVGRLQRIR